MKRLIIWLAILLPFIANAQVNGTIQKTASSGTIRGSFGSLGLDTIPRVTGVFVNGYILKYHAATNKWYASPDPTLVGLQDSLTKKANRTFDNVASGAIAKAKADTSANGLLPKSNLFPLGDTRYYRLSNPQLNGTGIVEMAGTTPSYLSSTGTGNVVKATSPALVTPVIGAATGTSLSLSGNSSASIFLADIGHRFNYAGVNRGGIFPWNFLTGSGSDYTPTMSSETGLGLRFFVDGGLTKGFGISTTGQPTFTALAGSGDVITGADNNGGLSKITVGPGLSLSAGVLTATGGSSGSVTTSGGTAGKIAKFTSASNIENSIMTESSGLISVNGNITAGANYITAASIARGGLYPYSGVVGGGADYSVGLYSEGDLFLAANGNSTKLLNLSTSLANWDVPITSSGNITALDAFILNRGAANRGGLYSYNQLVGSGTDYTPTLFGETGLGLNFSTNGSATPKMTLSTGGNLNVTGTIAASNFSGTSSGTNTGDQTTITGNAGTATALQTARNIQGVSFNGTADINPINGTGFVKASGTTLSYDNTTYAPLNSPTFTGTPSLPTGTIAVTQSANNNSTAVATTAYVDNAVSSLSTNSGQYNPTYTSGTNTSGITGSNVHYMRVGNQVTVHGRASLTTTGAGSSNFTISLPVASSLNVGTDLLGNASATNNSTNPVLYAESITDTAVCEFTADAGTTMTIYYSFMYTINSL